MTELKIRSKERKDRNDVGKDRRRKRQSSNATKGNELPKRE